MSTPAPDTSAQHALLNACRALLAPLAELAIARGVHHRVLDELLRVALVEAALAANPEVLRHRAASRVSTATGLNRREVGRLIEDRPVEERRASPATELFTRWISDPSLRDDDGRPRKSLPRQGAAPCFDTLAQAVTKDVHPRSVLEDMVRLGLVRVDEADDRVELLRDSFVPSGNEPRMLGFLSSNVGDHLRASVANVLAPAPKHLEQAMFADELSADSLERLRPLVREQWQQLLRALAPLVQGLVDDDAATGKVADQRVRVGMYSYHEPMAGAEPPPAKRRSAAARKSPSVRRTRS